MIISQSQASKSAVDATKASFASFSNHYRLILSFRSMITDLTAKLDLKIFYKYSNILISGPAAKSVAMLPILRINL